MLIKKEDAASEYIYVSSYFNKRAGKRIYARQFGLKAFRFKVKSKSQ